MAKPKVTKEEEDQELKKWIALIDQMIEASRRARAELPKVRAVATLERRVEILEDVCWRLAEYVFELLKKDAMRVKRGYERRRAEQERQELEALIRVVAMMGGRHGGNA